MAFDSLNQVLETIEKQPGWEIQQQYRRLLHAWATVVGSKVALQTRPLYLNRNVLWVATSSSSWAQTLSLQRYSLLKQLNAHLSETLVDIRFSPAQWYSQNRASPASFSAESQSQAQFPNPVEAKTDSDSFPELSQQTPQSAFQRWAQAIQLRSQTLPLCPRCQCPTPPDELQRWTFCAYCTTEQWTST